MARYIKDFYVNADPRMIHSILSQYLESEGYEYREYHKELVFKKGNGILTGPTFFKFTYYNGSVRMETWMKYAVAPGLYTGEILPSSFIGVLVKKPWKNRITCVENTLLNMANQLQQG